MRGAWWQFSRRIFVVIISIITNQITKPITARMSGFNIPPIGDGGCNDMPSGYIVLIFEEGEGIFCLEKLPS